MAALALAACRSADDVLPLEVTFAPQDTETLLIGYRHDGREDLFAAALEQLPWVWPRGLGSEELQLAFFRYSLEELGLSEGPIQGPFDRNAVLPPAPSALLERTLAGDGEWRVSDAPWDRLSALRVLYKCPEIEAVAHPVPNEGTSSFGVALDERTALVGVGDHHFLVDAERLRPAFGVKGTFQDAARAEDGAVWLVSEDQIVRAERDGEQSFLLEVKTSSSIGTVVDLAVRGRGAQTEVFVVTQDDRLLHFTAGTLQKLLDFEGIPALNKDGSLDQFGSIAVGPDDEVYAVKGPRLHRFRRNMEYVSEDLGAASTALWYDSVNRWLFAIGIKLDAAVRFWPRGAVVSGTVQTAYAIAVQRRFLYIIGEGERLYRFALDFPVTLCAELPLQGKFRHILPVGGALLLVPVAGTNSPIISIF